MAAVYSIAVIGAFVALVLFLWWKVFNSPNGERYLKMRVQGPFVPRGDDAQVVIDPQAPDLPHR